jgi:hypothetical protein
MKMLGIPALAELKTGDSSVTLVIERLSQIQATLHTNDISILASHLHVVRKRCDDR